MAIDWEAITAAGGIGKGTPRKRTKARKVRVNRAAVRDVRAYVFAREREICRCCRFRPAESMHEIKPKSLRGKVSRINSIAVCGSGTTGCHGHLRCRGSSAGSGGSWIPRIDPGRKAVIDSSWMRSERRHSYARGNDG
jgi:hypothetical protein